MAIDDPPIDLASLGRAYGLTAIGPISDVEMLEGSLVRAFDCARSGETVLVDVIVAPPTPREKIRSASA
jgi:hypothetical protein